MECSVLEGYGSFRRDPRLEVGRTVTPQALNGAYTRAKVYSKVYIFPIARIFSYMHDLSCTATLVRTATKFLCMAYNQKVNTKSTHIFT